MVVRFIEIRRNLAKNKTLLQKFANNYKFMLRRQKISNLRELQITVVVLFFSINISI